MESSNNTPKLLLDFMYLVMDCTPSYDDDIDNYSKESDLFLTTLFCPVSALSLSSPPSYSLTRPTNQSPNLIDNVTKTVFRSRTVVSPHKTYYFPEDPST